MNYPPPGTPVTPPPGTQPNPAYQDLLTLYAKVYEAEERLATALRPARRAVGDGETWTGHAAREWTADLEAWSRRLGGAAERIVAELAQRLRATPPYTPVGTEPVHPVPAQPRDPVSPAGRPGTRSLPQQ